MALDLVEVAHADCVLIALLGPRAVALDFVEVAHAGHGLDSSSSAPGSASPSLWEVAPPANVLIPHLRILLKVA